MDFNEETVKRYGLDFSLQDECKAVRQRNSTLKKIAMMTKFLELSDLQKYRNTVMAASEQPGENNNYHLRKPFNEILRYVESRIDELEKETAGQTVLITQPADLDKGDVRNHNPDPSAN